MTATLLTTLSVVVAFAMVGPWLARRLPPAVAARLLVPGCAMIAASGLWVLIMVGFTWVAQLGPVSRYGDWSAPAIRASEPFPTLVPIGCGLLAIGSALRSALLVRRRLLTIRAVRRICAEHGAAGSLVVLESDRPDAFATPGAHGRVVVTTALLRALQPDERRALIAHERAHLAHRHAWWLLVADVAAAANPLLRATATAVEHAVERWADEDAAREVTDRRLVARTLARTALLTNAAARAGSIPATGGDVPCRVRALLQPPPRPRIVPMAVLLALLIAVTASDATAERQGDQLLDGASRLAAAQQAPAEHAQSGHPTTVSGRGHGHHLRWLLVAASSEPLRNPRPPALPAPAAPRPAPPAARG